MSEEQKVAAFKDQRLYQNACKEISALGCPTNQSEIESIASELHKIASNSLEAAHDYIKLRMKVLPKGGEGAQQFEKLAIQAITNDQQVQDKIETAENLFRRVLKSGSNGDTLKAKAKETLKWAAIFQ